MKNPFKVKDKVYHFVHGWGEVMNLEDGFISNLFVEFSKTHIWLNHQELSFDEYEAPKVNHRRKVMIEVTEYDLMTLQNAQDCVFEKIGLDITKEEMNKIVNRIKKALEDEKDNSQ